MVETSRRQIETVGGKAAGEVARAVPEVAEPTCLPSVTLPERPKNPDGENHPIQEGESVEYVGP